MAEPSQYSHICCVHLLILTIGQFCSGIRHRYSSLYVLCIFESSEWQRIRWKKKRIEIHCRNAINKNRRDENCMYWVMLPRFLRVIFVFFVFCSLFVWVFACDSCCSCWEKLIIIDVPCPSALAIGRDGTLFCESTRVLNIETDVISFE